MRRAILILTLLVLAACGDTTGPELSGRYDLVQLVGEPVPGAKVPIDGELVTIMAGLLVLEQQRYTETLAACRNVLTVDCEELVTEGRYESEVDGGTGEITFYPDNSLEGYTATVQNGAITWGVAVYAPIQ